MLDWTAEQQVLIYIKKTIAEAWRMNSSQLGIYCQRLRKNQLEILPGQLGSVFLDILEQITAKDAGIETKVWSELMQDTQRLHKLIQEHQNLDESAWLAALPKLEAQQNRYFRTGLGMAFILVLKEKLHLTETVCRGDREEKKELEKLADWLLQDTAQGRPCRQKAVQTQQQMQKKRYIQKTGIRKHGILFPKELQNAAVPVFACLSACFLSVWLYGQIARNQNEWSAQQMKVSASQTDHDRDSVDISVEKKLVKEELQGDSGSQDKTESRPRRTKRPQILEQYREMAEEYPGLYGWLKIPDTQTDLPVMQPFKEKEYYLDHDFTGAESVEGSLFADPENNRWPQDGNTVIYGHNMKNGHMFGELDLYEDADYFQSHREIHFDTIYETGVYEAVAVIKTRILNENEPGFRYYQFFRYNSEEEFQECLDFIKANQLFDTDSKLKYGDRMLMLSTCEYSQENGRLVIVARKM